MASTRLALLCLGLAFVALGPLMPACANLGVPSACLERCEADSEGEPCQQCLAAEKQKREEARRKRAEERRQAQPAPGSGVGGSTGGY
jgi:hypothetical protein